MYIILYIHIYIYLLLLLSQRILHTLQGRRRRNGRDTAQCARTYIFLLKLIIEMLFYRVGHDNIL